MRGSFQQFPSMETVSRRCDLIMTVPQQSLHHVSCARFILRQKYSQPPRDIADITNISSTTDVADIGGIWGLRGIGVIGGIGGNAGDIGSTITDMGDMGTGVGMEGMGRGR